MLLHSASGNASGIPQTILDEKAAELRKKKEMQDAINVRISRPLYLHKSLAPPACDLAQACHSGSCASRMMVHVCCYFLMHQWCEES